MKTILRQDPCVYHTAAAAQQVDRIAYAELGLPDGALMQRAGAALFAQLRQRFPSAQRLLICCGSGNNAGDGYVLARLAHAAGWQVQVLQADGRELAGIAGVAQRAARDAGVAIEAFGAGDAASNAALPAGAGTVVVDALLGTGASGAPRSTIAAMIRRLNDCAAPCVAVDLPSGLHAQATGYHDADAVVQADVTVSFITRKLCNYSGLGVAAAGQRVELDLGVPTRCLATVDSVQGLRFTTHGLPQRSAAGHKHRHGSVVVVGGDQGMPGAVLLSAEARCAPVPVL